VERNIDPKTLRDMLERGAPVTVVDIRTGEERAEWSIPGSIHVNAYEALKNGDPEALAGVELPVDVLVVTVCGAGKTSAIASEQLRDRGFQAVSLEGGMKAWSLAWNTAEVPVEDSQV
jgi:rhodanese-related sulfurtransferase